jgi:hypothetical protein
VHQARNSPVRYTGEVQASAFIVLAVISTAVAIGCSPVEPPGDPCAGVTCAPGRACVQGRCEKVWTPPDGAVFPDQSWTPPDAGPKLADSGSDAPTGQWYPSFPPGAPCLMLCAFGGKVMAPSPEGAHCASGELRPASAVAAGIAFLTGCPNSDCSPQQGPLITHSVEQFCFKPGQKQDKNSTDLTMGCFCR